MTKTTTTPTTTPPPSPATPPRPRRGKPARVRFTTELDAALVERLDAEAARLGLPRAALIRMVLIERAAQ